MPKRVQVKVNGAALGEILRSRPVRAEVARRAENVAAAARRKTDDKIITAHAGRSRARSYVRRLGSGARGEANDRALGSSIDAARD